MKELFSLGEHWVSDFLKPGESPRGGKHDLKLVLDDNGTARLATTIPVEKMFGKYYYRSSINFTMRKELKDVVDSITNVYSLKDNDLWIDIASNDGCLLSNVPKNLTRMGVDPADDSYKAEAEQHSDLIIQDFFNFDSFSNSKYGHLKSKVISCCAMFYDLEFPDVFLQDVEKVLDDDGLFVVQLSYTPTMLSGLQFDNILSEHVFYYSLFNIKKLFEKNGFKVLDCTLNSCNGGSFRVFAMKDKGNEKLFGGSQAFRDIAKVRVDALLEYEKTLKLDSVETWNNFYNEINELKETTVSFIRKAKSEGKKVFAIGASTKGNTLLQFFGLTENDIDYIVERNPEKVGLRVPGSNIQICSEEFFREQHPEFALILIWPFVAEIIEREKEYLDKGGNLICPCPKFEIISK